MPGRFTKILFLSVCLLCCTRVAAAVDNLRADVEFLSDTLCAGRESGTRGAVEAAWYIRRRMEQLSLEPRIQRFCVPTADGKGRIICRNVVAEIRRPGATRWIVISAYYDGLGVRGGVFYPGADSNASGVAALLDIAEALTKIKSVYAGRYNILIAALDGHYADSEGAEELWRRNLFRMSVRMAVNLDIVGSSLSPVQPYYKKYVIALGAEPYRRILDDAAGREGLAIYYDYYGSRDFTNLFYRRMGDQKAYLQHGIPSVMFTSGITMHTNKVTDTAGTLDYEQLKMRISLILAWLAEL